MFSTVPMLRWSIQSVFYIVFLLTPLVASAQSEPPGDIMFRPKLGDHKILFIRVKYPDDERNIMTAQQAQVHVDQLKAIIQANSYDQLMLDIDVTPVLTMPHPTSFYQLDNRLPFVRIRADAIKIAEDAGFFERDYDREAIFTAKLWQQPITGAGGINNRTYYMAIRSSTVSAHELGHTFDWRHANFWRVASANPLDTAGVMIDYGDKFDIMGDHANFHHFNPWFKFRVGWLPPESILTVSESGTYIIRAIEKPPLSGSSVNEYSALRIRRDANTDYWIYYRSRENLANAGAMITRVEPRNTSYAMLLDMTPGSKPDSLDHRDAALVPGQTIQDQEAGIEITVLGKNSDSLGVQVVVPQTPIDTLPVIDIVNPASGKTVRGAITYEATAFDPDIGAVNGAGIDTVRFVLGYPERDDTSGEDYTFKFRILATRQLISPPYVFHVDTDSLPDEVYRIEVTAVSQNGEINTLAYKHIIDNTGPSVSTSVDEEPLAVAHTFQLQQNYPNPFNPSTTINYSVEQTGKVELRIYDLLGRKVRTLVQENMLAGKYTILWNGRNDSGKMVASGSYYYKLRIGEFISTKRMLLLK